MNDTSNTTRKYSGFFNQLLFILALLLIGGVIFWELKFFLSCFLGAVTLYVVLRKPFFWLTDVKQIPPPLAASILMVLLAAVFFAFGYMSFELIYSKIANVDASNLMSGVSDVNRKIKEVTGYELISMNLVQESKDIIIKIASTLVNKTYGVVANLLMMFFVLYVMFANAHSMEKTIEKYAPFDGENLASLKLEFKNMIMSNTVGIPLVMLVQGVIAALGYWIFGVSDFIFWGFFTGIFSVFPLIGTAVIWVPISIYLLAANPEPWAGIGMIIYSVAIITNIDNLVRMVLQKRMADTPAIITVFGVILGIPLFGFWGIIFGPLLISLFLLLIRIYHNMYGHVKT